MAFSTLPIYSSVFTSIYLAIACLRLPPYLAESRRFTESRSEQIPAPKKLALQITPAFSDETFVSSLLVMDSGFYPSNLDFLSIGSNLSTSFGPKENPAETWGLDFANLTVTGAAISPSAERAAVWGKTPDNPPVYFLNLFDARTAQQVAEVQKVNDPALSVFSAAFSPDGRLLASIDRSGTLSLWRVSRMQP